MPSLTTEQKGQIALLKIQEAAVRKGAFVYLPSMPGRCDLLLEYRGRYYRGQAKYADGKMKNAQGCVRLDLRRRKRCYKKTEIDVILAYFPQVDAVAWFGPEVFHEKSSLYLRIEPAKNGQKRGCRWLKDYIW